MGSNTTAPRPTAQQLSKYAGQAIVALATKKRDPIYSQTVTPSANPTLSIPLNNVGLLRTVLVKVVATVSNASGGVVNRSAIGAPNVLSNVQFVDLANYARIDTTGFHLHMVECMKRRNMFAAGFTNDLPGNYGANWSPISAPATIAAAGTGTVIMYYRIPVSYMDDDFRGAIWMNVSNAQARVNLTFNATPGIAAGVDQTNALYTGSANVSITTATVTVYQDYWDQIPQTNQGLLLPFDDMSWMLELKWSPFSGIPAGVESQFPYTNQRSFLSTILYYNNFPTPALGTDITSIRLAAANTYQHWKMDPLTAALENRLNIGDDFPAGFYAFDQRTRPISTVQWGNLALYLLPSTANAGAYANVYFEDFARATTIQTAASLPAGV